MATTRIETVPTKSAPPTDHEGPPRWLGTALLFVFLAVVTLAIVDRFVGLPFRMPRSWYYGRGTWYFIALASLAGGGWILGRRTRETDWSPTRPGRRFGAVVLFTREGCHLCDQAALVLERHRRWLPPVEVVDIDTDPRLTESYGESIPVVRIDGVDRFKGRVEEFALRRLIEGTTPD